MIFNFVQTESSEISSISKKRWHIHSAYIHRYQSNRLRLNNIYLMHLCIAEPCCLLETKKCRSNSITLEGFLLIVFHDLEKVHQLSFIYSRACMYVCSRFFLLESRNKLVACYNRKSFLLLMAYD